MFVDSPKITKDPSTGYLTIEGVAHRIGTLEYKDDLGRIVTAFRPEEEVKKTVKLLIDKPVSVEHPESKVTLDNSDPVVGIVKDAKYKNGLVEFIAVIFDKEGVEAIEQGKKFLSIGTEIEDKVSKAGVFFDKYGVQGEPGNTYDYDLIHQGIHPNHLALTDAPRAGSIACLELDSANIEIKVKEAESNMSKPQTKTEDVKHTEAPAVSEDSVVKDAEYSKLNIAGGDLVPSSAIEEYFQKMMSGSLLPVFQKMIEDYLSAKTASLSNTKTDAVMDSKTEMKAEEKEEKKEPMDIKDAVNSEIKKRADVAKMAKDSLGLTMDMGMSAEDMYKDALNSYMKDNTYCDSSGIGDLAAAFKACCDTAKRMYNDSAEKEKKEKAEDKPKAEIEKDSKTEVTEELELDSVPEPKSTQVVQDSLSALQQFGSNNWKALIGSK